LFDFDGTLADSYAAITASVNHVRAQHGLTPLPVDAVRVLVGHGILDLMPQVAPGDPVANAAIYRAHHPSVAVPLTHILPGVVETLTRLQAAGCRLGVCSNKPSAFTRLLVAELNLARFFGVVVGPEDVAGRAKPAPDMLWLAMRELALTPADTVYVGDMTVDIATAKAAGVPVWVLATGSHDEATLRAAEPERFLTAFTDILG
jgi:phosphoglycolate phosphatase